MQISWKCCCLLATLSLLSTASHVSADIIRLTTGSTIDGNVFVAHHDEAGNILASGSDGFSEHAPLPVDFWNATDMAAAAIFSASGTAAASQSWTAHSNRFHSVGRATATAGANETDFVQVNSISIYVSTFRLTTPFDYVWNSVVASVGGSGSLVTLGTAEAAFISSFSRSGAVAFTQSGTLAPGDYVIIGQSDTIALAGPIFGHPILNEASNSFSIDLSLTPSAVVAEPATLILVGTGTAGLWCRRKRRI